MRRLVSLFIYVALVLVLYKYVISQYNLIDPKSGWTWVSITCLLAISFMLGGFETAVTSIGKDELRFLDFIIDIDKRREDINKHLSDSIVDTVAIIRNIADILFFLRKVLVVASFTVVKTVILEDGTTTRRREIDVEKCISLTLTLGIIIDVNVTVLLSSALTESKTFSHSVLSIGFIGSNQWLEGVLPWAGKEGFTSVGATMFILVLVEVLPKKIAFRNPDRFIRYGGWVMAPIYITYLPAILSANVDETAEFIMNSAVRFIKLFKSR